MEIKEGGIDEESTTDSDNNNFAHDAVAWVSASRKNIRALYITGTWHYIIRNNIDF